MKTVTINGVAYRLVRIKSKAEIQQISSDPTFKAIIEACEKVYNVNIRGTLNIRRSEPVTMAKYTAIYLLDKHLPYNRNCLTAALGRSHNTVTLAVNRIKFYLSHPDKYHSLITKCEYLAKIITNEKDHV